MPDTAAVRAKETGRMLNLEDCIELSKLTEDEIRAIAAHEHIPEMAALELGNYLVAMPDGRVRIKAMIREDIARAGTRGEWDRVLALKLMLKRYVAEHPDLDERTANGGHVPERRFLARR